MIHHRHHQGRASLSLSKRRGARPLPGGRRAGLGNQVAGSFRHSNPIVRIAIGSVVIYALSNAILHPIDSKETSKFLTQQRGGPSQHHAPSHHKPGDKHSPLMLLREREQAYREQREKQESQKLEVDAQIQSNGKEAIAQAIAQNELRMDPTALDKNEVNVDSEANDANEDPTDDTDPVDVEDKENEGGGDKGNEPIDENGEEGGVKQGEWNAEAESNEERVDGDGNDILASEAVKGQEYANNLGQKNLGQLKQIRRNKQAQAEQSLPAIGTPKVIVEQQALLQKLEGSGETLSEEDRNRIMIELQQGQNRIAAFVNRLPDPNEQQRWTKELLALAHRLVPLMRSQQHNQRRQREPSTLKKIYSSSQHGDLSHKEAKEPQVSQANPVAAAEAQIARQVSSKVNGTERNGTSEAQLNATSSGQKAKKGKPKNKTRKLPKMDHNADAAGPIEGDPLRAITWPFEHKRIEMKPAVEYLGTLVDGGRHYFSIEWLKRLVDRLSDMNYNLIHLRLTDDQTFNILLTSRPQLAYPQAFDNPKRKVWTVEEMKDLTSYAKAKGVSIMPEINVPGHAGSWYGIPDMVVHCPRFICERGYGLPLNVTHHELKPILTDVIKEVVSIFDDPPFLHLGGDEVNMADPCFHEVGRERFDYPAFEKVLKGIVKDSGYPEDRVVRWEMTGQAGLDRTGDIEHFWESHPGDRHDATGRFFVSTWMYLDTNAQQNSVEVYEKANINFHRGGKLPTAIIVGTFELSEQFWYDRNVLGRLLSVAIGANNPTLSQDHNEKVRAVSDLWSTHCDTLGLGDIICETNGMPVVETRHYHAKWRQGWDIWKKDICDRLTEKITYKGFRQDMHGRRHRVVNANDYFWSHFPLETTQLELVSANETVLPEDLKAVTKHRVQHSGVLIDAVGTLPKLSRVHEIIHSYVAALGFNLVQVRLVGKAGFSFIPASLPSLAQSVLSDNDKPLYSLEEFASLVKSAATIGVAILPEITVSTDASGWINAGFTVDCPIRFCNGKSLSNDVNSPELLPILYSVIGELRSVFNSSKFFHLGPDERSAASPCWDEAGETPDFEKFESKLEALLALVNLAPEETIRWENTEGFRYPTRAGGVTQYPPGQIDDIRTGDLFFLTIDLFDGDAYSIFRNAKKAVALQPLGILADVPKLSESKFENWEIPKRLLAFAMGISELTNAWSFNDETTFLVQFEQLCRALNVSDDCSPPGDAEAEIAHVTESSEFIQKQCEAFLTVEDVLVAKKPVIPWFETRSLAPFSQSEG